MKEMCRTDFPVLGFLDGDPVVNEQIYNDDLDFPGHLSCSLLSEQELGGASWTQGDLDTNKLVVISAFSSGKWSDESLSLTLSPLMATALVRRLIDTLDRVQRESSKEAVPSIHSDFAYKLASAVFDGETLGLADLDYYLELQSALRSTDGEKIASILPPSIR